MRVHHVEHGDGLPFVALHGVGVDHRELAGALEPVFTGTPGTPGTPGVPGVRRVYPDLPGMGGTAAPARLRSNDDVVDVLLGFVDQVVGDGPFVVGGHSLGGYLARAVAARRREQVAGLVLVCPAARSAHDVPPHVAVRTEPGVDDVLDPDDVAGFEEYLVVRTPSTALRYRERVLPGARLVDDEALGRVLARWELRDEPGPQDPQPYPTLILAGRQDAFVGWSDASRLLDVYPRATLTVLDGAGHALLHEHPDVVAALLRHWFGGLPAR